MFRFIAILFMAMSCSALAADVTLGASSFATYVNEEGKPARLNAIITEAFERMPHTVKLEVLRPAFLGSGISTGQIQGRFAFISLEDPKAGYLYSEGYLPLRLYAASKYEDVREFSLFSHLESKRVAVENQFVNTDRMRRIKGIKWSRNPTTFDAFKQLADDRARYLFTSRLLLDEFNRLLRNNQEEQLALSAAPLATAHFKVAIREDVAQADAILNSFNSAIVSMQKDGTFNRLLALPWLMKDVNDDGIADYLTSVHVAHPEVSSEVLALAFPLDDSQPAEQSLYFVDGKKQNWQQVQTILQEQQPILRDSLLDKDRYSTILRRW